MCVLCSALNLPNLLEGLESGPLVFAPILATTGEFQVVDFFLSSTRVELSKSVLKTVIGKSVVEYWMAEVSRAL